MFNYQGHCSFLKPCSLELACLGLPPHLIKKQKFDINDVFPPVSPNKFHGL